MIFSRSLSFLFSTRISRMMRSKPLDIMGFWAQQCCRHIVSEVPLRFLLKSQRTQPNFQAARNTGSLTFASFLMIETEKTCKLQSLKINIRISLGGSDKYKFTVYLFIFV